MEPCQRLRRVHTALHVAHLGPLVEAVEQHNAAVALEQTAEHACEKATALIQESFLYCWTLHSQAEGRTQYVALIASLSTACSAPFSSTDSLRALNIL